MTKIDIDFPVTLDNINTRPYIVDLFSGCGGLAYGFLMEGLKISSGLELDANAWKTASYNLHWKFGSTENHKNNDIKEITADELIQNPNKPVITIGGPPCQAYSIAGRAKLQSLGKDRFGLNDDRAFLYKEFLRLSLDLDSEAIVMENVPESVDFLGMNIPQIVCDELEKNGYNATWTILNSADYGVPQTRRRVFVMAIKKEYGDIIFLPEPTHSNLFEYSEEQQLARYQKFTKMKNFSLPKVGSLILPTWVTVKEALSDLPVLFPTSCSKFPKIKMETKYPYKSPPLNDFQREMRTTKDNSILHTIDANSFRRTTRDFKIFEKMNYGDNYLDAHKTALELFNDACIANNINKINNPIEFEELKKEYVPPYDTTKFHTKWRKLDPKIPSHTLVAHLGTDTYSHINPFEPRGISVREAARLQSFPDDFVFNVPMGSAFTQIGNAVPPLLSKAVAKAIVKNLNQ